MRVKSRYIVALLVTILCGATASYGQAYKERRHIRKGNSLYEEQRMEEAQKSYRSALQQDSLSVEGRFNLGDSQYAMGDFAAAEESFKGLVERNNRLTDEQRAKAYYNLGNAQFQQQKLQEALESYKSSLRLRPEDLEAKFNYAYTKALMEEQENNQNQQNQDQNQDQNQSQDQQQDQQQNQDQQGEQPPQQQPQEEPQGEKPQPSDQPEGGQQPSEGPRQESEQMLDAVQAAEDRTREKVDAQKAVGVARSGKNW